MKSDSGLIHLYSPYTAVGQEQTHWGSKLAPETTEPLGRVDINEMLQVSAQQCRGRCFWFSCQEFNCFAWVIVISKNCYMIVLEETWGKSSHLRHKRLQPYFFTSYEANSLHWASQKCSFMEIERNIIRKKSPTLFWERRSLKRPERKRKGKAVFCCTQRDMSVKPTYTFSVFFFYKANKNGKLFKKKKKILFIL